MENVKPSLLPGECLLPEEPQTVLAEAGDPADLPLLQGPGGGGAQQAGRAGRAGELQVSVWGGGGPLPGSSSHGHSLSLQCLQVTTTTLQYCSTAALLRLLHLQ